MIVQWFLKCSVSLFIIFLIRPKGIQTLASIGKQQEYYHAVKRSGGPDFPQQILRSDLTKPLHLREDEEIRYSINDVPGFDLTEEEIKKFKIWRDGIIPYYIDVVSYNDKELRDQIHASLAWLNIKTALRFQELPTPPKNKSTRWVFFSNRRGQLGCSDHSIQNFTNEGVQLVHMGYDCLSEDLAEAILLLVGIPAQHTSPDRDKYIKVIEENIIPEKRDLFKKLHDTERLFHDVEYDYASATHFDTHRHSKNGRVTIQVLGKDDDNLGGQSKITKSDIHKIRMLYNYMVMKTSRKIPDCIKLFKKGPNFYKKLNGVDEPKPRKKGNKYLGIAVPDQSDLTYNDIKLLLVRDEITHKTTEKSYMKKKTGTHLLLLSDYVTNE